MAAMISSIASRVRRVRRARLRLLGRTLVGVAAAMAGLPAAAAAQGDVAEVAIRDTLPLRLGDVQALGVLVTARDSRRLLVRAPRLTFVALDTAVVDVWADTVFGKAAGVGRVVVSAMGARRRVVADTVAIVVADAAGGSGPQGYAAMGGRAAPAEARTLPRLPSGTVLAPQPAAIRLLPGETVRIEPLVRRTADSAVVGRLRVAWETPTPAVATITAAGVVTAVAPGTGRIRVVPEAGPAISLDVQVDTAGFRFEQPRLALGAGEQRPLRLIVPSQDGRPLAGSAVRWSSSDTAVAQVAEDGTVRGVAEGEARIVASGPSHVDTLVLAVHPPIDRLRLSPTQGDTTTVPLGGRTHFVVTPVTRDGAPVAGVPVVWRVADTAVASVDTLGALTGKAAGPTRLIAQVGADSVVWPVRVVPGRVALDRERLALHPGASAPLALRVLDDTGHVVLQVSDAEWRSSDTAVATVAGGTVAARRPGRALVVAAGPGGRTDTALVLVTEELLVVTARAGAPPRLYQAAPARPGELAAVPLEVDSVFRAAYSPDGARLALLAAQHDTIGIFVADADGREVRRYVHGLAPQIELAWMPDGRRVLYSVPGADSTMLYVEDLTASRWAPFGAVTGRASPAVAGDGRILLAATRRDATTFYLVDAGGGPPRPVTAAGTIRRGGLPQWGADGMALYTADDGSGDARYRVVRFDPATGARQVLATSPTPFRALAAGPGGTVAWVVEGRGRDAPATLVVRDPNGALRQTQLQPGERPLMLSF